MNTEKKFDIDLVEEVKTTVSMTIESTIRNLLAEDKSKESPEDSNDGEKKDIEDKKSEAEKESSDKKKKEDDESVEEENGKPTDEKEEDDEKLDESLIVTGVTKSGKKEKVKGKTLKDINVLAKAGNYKSFTTKDKRTGQEEEYVVKNGKLVKL